MTVTERIIHGWNITAWVDCKQVLAGIIAEEIEFLLRDKYGPLDIEEYIVTVEPAEWDDPWNNIEQGEPGGITP